MTIIENQLAVGPSIRKKRKGVTQAVLKFVHSPTRDYTDVPPRLPSDMYSNEFKSCLLPGQLKDLKMRPPVLPEANSMINIFPKTKKEMTHYRKNETLSEEDTESNEDEDLDDTSGNSDSPDSEDSEDADFVEDDSKKTRSRSGSISESSNYSMHSNKEDEGEPKVIKSKKHVNKAEMSFKKDHPVSPESPRMGQFTQVGSLYSQPPHPSTSLVPKVQPHDHSLPSEVALAPVIHLQPAPFVDPSFLDQMQMMKIEMEKLQVFQRNLETQQEAILSARLELDAKNQALESREHELKNAQTLFEGHSDTLRQREERLEHVHNVLKDEHDALLDRQNTLNEVENTLANQHQQLISGNSGSGSFYPPGSHPLV